MLFIKNLSVCVKEYTALRCCLIYYSKDRWMNMGSVISCVRLQNFCRHAISTVFVGHFFSFSFPFSVFLEQKNLSMLELVCLTNRNTHSGLFSCHSLIIVVDVVAVVDRKKTTPNSRTMFFDLRNEIHGQRRRKKEDFPKVFVVLCICFGASKDMLEQVFYC